MNAGERQLQRHGHLVCQVAYSYSVERKCEHSSADRDIRGSISGLKKFSLLHNIHIGSGTNPVIGYQSPSSDRKSAV